MQDRGWISIHRKMATNWIWEGKPFSYGQAWIDILMECNHAERKQLIKGQLITTKRGQSSNSVGTWAKRFGWSYDMVRHFFKLLESDGMITKENATVTTILNVCNYDTYQNVSQAKPTQDTTKPQAEPKQNPTNNKGNNLNNENNVYRRVQGLDLLKSDYAKLLKDYSISEIDDVLTAMDNHKDLKKKYVSAYLTALNWLKRRSIDKPKIPQLPKITR